MLLDSPGNTMIRSDTLGEPKIVQSSLVRNQFSNHRVGSAFCPKMYILLLLYKREFGENLNSDSLPGDHTQCATQCARI